MKLIIAGGRYFNDYSLLVSKLDKILINVGKCILITGECRGADQLGIRYASENKWPKPECYPADWDRFGRRAGPIRNEQMAKAADSAVIFWDGKSRGTLSMINLSKQYQLNLRVIKYR